MTSARLSPFMLVCDLLQTYPETAEVFHKWNLACPSGWLTDMHTIADIAIIFELDLQALMRDLREAIGERPRGLERS